MGDAGLDVAAAAVERPRSPARTVLILLLIVAVGVAIWTSGVLDIVTSEEELRATVDDAGAWGPVVYLALMILLVPLSVPGVLFSVPATTLFGTPLGLTLAFLGGYIGSVIGIVGARRLGRRAVEHRLPLRVRKWEQRFSQRGFWAVTVARCLTYLFQPLDWLCGISSIPMRTALAGTFVGLIPPTLVVCLSGGGLLDLLL
ncbi:MAG: VTT domain-containing protein [Acidimicrobiales bacterium]|nr:VTT domain-containing protein [Acidimicrobiales bacterium]